MQPPAAEKWRIAFGIMHAQEGFHKDIDCKHFHFADFHPPQLFGRLRIPALNVSPYTHYVGTVNFRIARLLPLCAALLIFSLSASGQISVRHKEGLVHGFLVLRSEQGETLAHGELSQEAHGNRVTVHTAFRFKDGSAWSESATYSQVKTFRLLQYKSEQKGPSFKQPLTLSIDVPAGQVNVRYTDDGGKEKDESAHMTLPNNLTNGMLFTLLKNGPFEGEQAQAAMIVATPKPRLVKMEISTDGEDTVLAGDTKHKATRYRVKLRVGGIYGLAVSLAGKQPPDLQVWILPGSAPAFLKSSGTLVPNGPIWQIELESPVWPKQ